MPYSISRLFRYPVKSMLGESLDRALVGPGGIVGDRGWALKDEASGNILSAKRAGTLLQCSARYVEELSDKSIPHVEITFPDGAQIRSDDRSVNRRLSDFLGQAVSLWPIQPATDTEHYRMKRDPDADMEQELRQMFALEPDEGLPDFSKFPPEMLAELTDYASPRGTYFDAFPVNVLTEASLRHLSQLMPGTGIGTERFRPNILVSDSDQACDPIEFGWVEKQMKIGGVRLDIVMECPRCVMVTRAQPGYEKASAIMRTLVKELDHNLSVYANIAAPGIIRVGDPVEIR